MKVIVNKEIIIQGLQKAASILPAKAGASYLRTIWINCEHETINFFSTDASVEFYGFYPATIVESGIVGVQGQILYNLVSTCEGEITIATDASNQYLTLNHKLGICKLPLMDISWFKPPQPFPREPIMSCPADILRDALEHTIYCLADSNPNNIPGLDCLTIQPEESNTVIFTGLDCFKFSIYSINNESIFKNLPENGLALNKKFAQQLLKWIGKDDVYITYNNRKVFFRNNNEVIDFPIGISAAYDYKTMLDKFDDDGLSVIKFRRLDLLNALNRIITIDTNEEGYIDLYLSEDNNNITCSAFGQNSGEVSENINVEYSGNIRKISYKNRQLIEVLQHFSSENMAFTLTSETSASRLEGPEDPFYTAVIMPVHLMTKKVDVEEI